MDRLARELRIQEALLVYMAAKSVDLLSVFRFLPFQHPSLKYFLQQGL